MSKQTNEKLESIVKHGMQSNNTLAVEAALAELQRRSITMSYAEDAEPVVVKNYKGSEIGATKLYERDAMFMSKKGYYPTSQSWAQGSYGCGSFIIALILCFLIIGILIFIYMLLSKPDGTLSVTYKLKKIDSLKTTMTPNQGEKECPSCAERVKERAKKCRYCGHEF